MDIHIESMVKKAQQRLYFLRPAEEVQPATGAAETVLLCHHWISALHINNCLVQLSYQIWSQKTTEGSPDCWANHWYNPPQSPRTLLIQSEQKSWQNHSGPLTSSLDPHIISGPLTSSLDPHIQHTPSLNCYHLVDATEQWAPERPDTGTVSSLRQSISWTLDTKRGTHNTIIQLFIHHTNVHISDLTHYCLYCISCF